MIIRSFTGVYRFLSNFYPSPLIYRGIGYPTAEHAYQAQKTLDREKQIQIALLLTARGAKQAGNALYLRPDWNDKTRINEMLGILQEKFSIPSLAQKLKATGDASLIEGNSWGDVFWGTNSDGVGTNHLGRLLMRIRDKL